MIDELLEKVGLKYEDLNAIEKETLMSWLETIQKGQITVEKIREYINSMKDSVEQELTKYDLGSKQDLFLKARLRNYLLLDSFMTTPEKAKKQMENAISSMVGKKA
jgi:hypothetical protein